MVFQGFGRSYWTVSWTLDDDLLIIAINQLAKSNVHLTKSLNQRSIALFHLFGKYLIQSKIAILSSSFSLHYNKLS